MFTFEFTYRDKQHLCFEHISSADYFLLGDHVSVAASQISTHRFPIGIDIRLMGNSQNVTVSGENLVSIKVSEE